MTITLPSKAKLMDVINQHSQENAGLLLMFLRMACYCIGMLLSCFLAERFFCDTYLSNLCIFFLAAVGIELLWNRGIHLKNRVRSFCYIVCVAMIILVGSLLIQQSKCCQACCTKGVSASINK